jgi:dephospho-CoA kinase
VEAILSSTIAIEGIRSLRELEEIKSRFEATTIAIHASPNSRFQRLLSRNRSDDPKTWEVFYERDNRELDVGLGQVIALADMILVNEGTITELQSKFKEFVAKLNVQ